MKVLDHPAAGFAVALCLAGALPAQAQLPSSNPFASPSPLLDQAPPFDKIKDSDFLPAFEEGMKQQRAEIDAIADNPQPPTFENTIVAMERSGELLTRVAKVFFNLDQSDTNEARRKIKAEMAPKLAAHNDAINLNPKLYARIKALYEKRDQLGLDPEGKYLIERDHLSFIRSGAELSDADKATLTALEPGRIEADHRVHRQGAQGDQRRRGRRPERERARRSLRPGRRGGRPGGQGPQARGSMAAGAPEHDAAAGARIADRPRTAAARARGLRAPGRGRSRRHPADRRPAGRAARAEGEAARVFDLRGIRPRRSDGEDAGKRREAHDRSRARLDRQGAGGGGPPAEADRRREGRFLFDGGRLGALL